jgi:hypothetical protein
MKAGALQLAVFAAVPVAMLVGAIAYVRWMKQDPAMREAMTDRLLARLQAANPTLAVTTEFKNLPIYWIEERSTGRKVALPKSEAPGATIRFEECRPSRIAKEQLYPNRSEMVCLVVDNDEHRLDAYYFRTKDRLRDVVGFYNEALEPNRRFTPSRSNTEERHETRKRADGARELIYSYLLHQDYDLWGFVGYREERKAPPG